MAKKKKKIDLEDVRVRLLAAEQQLNGTFVQRGEAIHTIILGLLSHNNYLFVGDPGTAKTSVIDRFTMHIETDKRFKCLMGSFTQPDDVFGSLDIEAFKKGKRQVVTEGMFTEAAHPILDETLKSSDGCMNSLLGVLAPEREFKGKKVDVICTGGATNWPEVEEMSRHLEALFDRFLLRVHVTPVDRTNKVLRRKLYRAKRAVKRYAPAETTLRVMAEEKGSDGKMVMVEKEVTVMPMVTVPELLAAHADVLDVEISDAIIDLLDGLVGRLIDGAGGNASILVSDRRSTDLQTVLQANAWLDGRDQVTLDDFNVLHQGLWNKRRDLTVASTLVATLDAVALQECLRELQRGRGIYRNVAAAGFGPSAVNTAVSEMKAIAIDIQGRLAEPIFRAESRTEIKDAVLEMRVDYDDLRSRAFSHGGVSKPTTRKRNPKAGKTRPRAQTSA